MFNNGLVITRSVYITSFSSMDLIDSNDHEQNINFNL